MTAAPVVLGFSNEVARASCVLGDNWRIDPTDELLQELRYLYGENAVELVFS